MPDGRSSPAAAARAARAWPSEPPGSAAQSLAARNGHAVVLPPANRLTDAASFREATRRGRRAAGRRLVTHLLSPAGAVDGGPARVGFVVSRAVGNAVTRNQVQRRLRHLVRAQLSELPPASILVVRALPPSATASSADLGADLTRCLDRVRVRA